MKNILELTNIKLKKFLLKEESYINFELPIYFSFNQMLSKFLKNSKVKVYQISIIQNHVIMRM